MVGRKEDYLSLSKIDTILKIIGRYIQPNNLVEEENNR